MSEKPTYKEAVNWVLRQVYEVASKAKGCLTVFVAMSMPMISWVERECGPELKDSSPKTAERGRVDLARLS